MAASVPKIDTSNFDDVILSDAESDSSYQIEDYPTPQKTIGNKCGDVAGSEPNKLNTSNFNHAFNSDSKQQVGADEKDLITSITPSFTDGIRALQAISARTRAKCQEADAVMARWTLDASMTTGDSDVSSVVSNESNLDGDVKDGEPRLGSEVVQEQPVEPFHDMLIDVKIQTIRSKCRKEAVEIDRILDTTAYSAEPALQTQVNAELREHSRRITEIFGDDVADYLHQIEIRDEKITELTLAMHEKLQQAQEQKDSHARELLKAKQDYEQSVQTLSGKFHRTFLRLKEDGQRRAKFMEAMLRTIIEGKICEIAKVESLEKDADANLRTLYLQMVKVRDSKEALSEEKDDKIQLLRSQLEGALAQVEEKTQQLSIMDQKFAAYSTYMQDMENSNTQHVNGLMPQLHASEKERKNSMLLQAQQERETGLLSNAIKKLKQELGQVKQSHHDDKGHEKLVVKDLMAEMEIIKSELLSLSDNKAGLTQTNSKLTNEIREYKSLLESRTEDYNRLAVENIRIQTDTNANLESAAKKAVEDQKEISELKRAASRLIANQQILEADLIAMQANASRSIKIALEQDEIERRNRKGLDEFKLIVRNKVQELRESRDVERERANVLQSKIAGAELRVSEAQEGEKTLEKNLSKLKRSNIQLTADVETLQSNSQQATTKIENLQKHTLFLEKNFDRVQEKNLKFLTGFRILEEHKKESDEAKETLMTALDDASKEAQVKMDRKFTDFYELLQNFVEDGALDEEYTSLIRMYFSSLFRPVEIARVSLEKDRSKDDTRMSQLTEAVKEEQQRITATAEQIADRDATISELRDTLDEYIPKEKVSAEMFKAHAKLIKSNAILNSNYQAASNELMERRVDAEGFELQIAIYRAQLERQQIALCCLRDSHQELKRVAETAAKKDENTENTIRSVQMTPQNPENTLKESELLVDDLASRLADAGCKITELCEAHWEQVKRAETAETQVAELQEAHCEAVKSAENAKRDIEEEKKNFASVVEEMTKGYKALLSKTKGSGGPNPELLLGFDFSE